LQAELIVGARHLPNRYARVHAGDKSGGGFEGGVGIPIRFELHDGLSPPCIHVQAQHRCARAQIPVDVGVAVRDHRDLELLSDGRQHRISVVIRGHDLALVNEQLHPGEREPEVVEHTEGAFTRSKIVGRSRRCDGALACRHQPRRGHEQQRREVTWAGWPHHGSLFNTAVDVL